MKIRKNDNVLVIAGKDRGKKGKVHWVIPKHNRVLVEGINMIKRHTRPRPGIRQVGIIEREAPIYMSNVMLICAKCDKPVRLGSRTLEDGKKVRVCRSCHEIID